MKRNRKGFTLIEMLAVLTIVVILGITVGVSMNKLSQNTKDSNNETVIKQLLFGAQTYCKLSNSNCEGNISLNDLISSGTLDEDILLKINPTKNSNIKFKDTDEVSRIINPITKEEDYIYKCGTYEYKLSTIDGCTKKGLCKWGECNEK